ncbi:putative SWAP/Surp superfamily protein [Arabidopsis thaliana]
MKELRNLKLQLLLKFVGRYGEEFWLDLIKEVDNKPQFEFLKPADSKFDYFNRLSVVASEGLKRSEKLTSSRMAIVSKAFFYHLRRQNEKRELTHKEGAAKACTLFGALYAFVGAHGCFADIKDEDLPLLQHPSAIKNILTASYASAWGGGGGGNLRNQSLTSLSLFQKTSFLLNIRVPQRSWFLFQTPMIGKSLRSQCSRYRKTWQV